MGNCWGTSVEAESLAWENSPRNIGSTNERGVVKHGELVLESINGDLSLIPSISSGSLQAFSFNELCAATRKFRPSLIRPDGSGCVFKGWIDEQTLKAMRPGTGSKIAVKKLNQESLQGQKEWLAKVYFLGQLHHPHLVKLFGYCAEDDHRPLVYEFMGCGSLEDHLFRRDLKQALSWAIRMRVCVGVARALAFLHAVDPPVIYRDLKPSNILLDSDYNAKLSDLGVAKDIRIGDTTHVSTQVMGTYGYAAPEYIATGHLTTKNDIYGFGVVLLEILTGRRPFDKNRCSSEQSLVEWAKPYLADKHKVHRIMDYGLQGHNGAHQVAVLALNCLNTDPKSRPLIKDVVSVLESLQETRATEYSGKDYAKR